MEIRIYFVDGSRTCRDQIIDIADEEDNIVTIDNDGFEMRYEKKHIASIMIVPEDQEEQ